MLKERLAHIQCNKIYSTNIRLKTNKKNLNLTCKFVPDYVFNFTMGHEWKKILKSGEGKNRRVRSAGKIFTAAPH